MTDSLVNPVAVRGHNEAPDYAREVTERMARDYAAVTTTVDELLSEARTMPGEVNDDETMGVCARLIKRLRDTAARIEAFRVKEKEPYLRGEQAVDAFFFIQRDKVVRRDRKAKAGAADILQDRVDNYQQRKLAAERVARERAQREAQEVERKRIEAETEARRVAEEARLAAERARKPETREVKEDAAQVAEQAADVARVDTLMAQDATDAAVLATKAKSADIVRTRVEDGPTVTMRREGYTEIVDDALLDKNALWAFISLTEKEKALRAWARTTNHQKTMAGAIVEMRDKTVVR